MQEDTPATAFCPCLCVRRGGGSMWWMTVQHRGVLGLIVMSERVCGNPGGERWQTGVCRSVRVFVFVEEGRVARVTFDTVLPWIFGQPRTVHGLSGDRFDGFGGHIGCWKSGSVKSSSTVEQKSRALFSNYPNTLKVLEQLLNLYDFCLLVFGHFCSIFKAFFSSLFLLLCSLNYLQWLNIMSVGAKTFAQSKNQRLDGSLRWGRSCTFAGGSAGGDVAP